MSEIGGCQLCGHAKEEHINGQMKIPNFCRMSKDENDPSNCQCDGYRHPDQEHHARCNSKHEDGECICYQCGDQCGIGSCTDCAVEFAMAEDHR